MNAEVSRPGWEHSELTLPELNPNPVLILSSDYQCLFSNPAAETLAVQGVLLRIPLFSIFP